MFFLLFSEPQDFGGWVLKSFSPNFFRRLCKSANHKTWKTHFVNVIIWSQDLQSKTISWFLVGRIQNWNTTVCLLLCLLLRLLWDAFSKFRPGHTVAQDNLSKVVNFMTNTTTASKYIPKRPKICISWNSPFQTSKNKPFKIWILFLSQYDKCAHCGKISLSKMGSERGDFNWCWFWAF